MRYSDGHEAHIGDHVAIDEKYRGTVVACIDLGEYSIDHPKEQWSYLRRGIMVNTDFGGLVHYPDALNERIVLLRRADDL